MSNSDIEQTGTVKGHLSNGLSLSGHISIGGASTAEEVSYTNTQFPNVENVKGALDAIAETQQQHEDDINVLGGAINDLGKNSHTHDNKDTLDKFGESEDGNPTFNGKVLGDGSEKEIFKIPVTITAVEAPADGEQFKVEHTVTIAELEAATKEGKTPIVLVDLGGGLTYILPLLYYVSGTYFFSLVIDMSAINMIISWSEGAEEWRFAISDVSVQAEDVYYYNRYLNQINSVKGALDKLIPKQVTSGTTITLANNTEYRLRDVTELSLYSVLLARVIVVPLIPKQVTSGTTITLANNTEYRLRDVTELSIEYPYDNFECWMRLTFASSGNITVTLPANTKYIGTAPDFKNGETWEMSIKDGIVIAGTVE